MFKMNGTKFTFLISYVLTVLSVNVASEEWIETIIADFSGGQLGPAFSSCSGKELMEVQKYEDRDDGVFKKPDETANDFFISPSEGVHHYCMESSEPIITEDVDNELYITIYAGGNAMRPGKFSWSAIDLDSSEMLTTTVVIDNKGWSQSTIKLPKKSSYMIHFEYAQIEGDRYAFFAIDKFVFRSPEITTTTDTSTTTSETPDTSDSTSTSETPDTSTSETPDTSDSTSTSETPDTSTSETPDTSDSTSTSETPDTSDSTSTSETPDTSTSETPDTSDSTSTSEIPDTTTSGPWIESLITDFRGGSLGPMGSPCLGRDLLEVKKYEDFVEFFEKPAGANEFFISPSDGVYEYCMESVGSFLVSDLGYELYIPVFTSNTGDMSSTFSWSVIDIKNNNSELTTIVNIDDSRTWTISTIEITAKSTYKIRLEYTGSGDENVFFAIDKFVLKFPNDDVTTDDPTTTWESTTTTDESTTTWESTITE